MAAAHNMSQSSRRANAVRMPLSELRGGGWRFLLQCPRCRDERAIDVDALAERYGPDVRVGEIAPRFTCSRPDARGRLCGSLPERVVLVGRRASVILHGPGAFA